MLRQAPRGYIVCVDCNDGKTLIHRNWTPKQPEPVKGDNMEKAVHIETNVEGLKITIRSDGVWFDFQSCKGYASLNISQYAADHKGKIIGPVIAEWCKKITPEQPEPAAPVNKGFNICEGCKYRYKKASFYAKCVGCFGENYEPIPKEPKAEPGLVPYPIIGGKGNKLWLVQMPAGAIALYKAVGRTDFAYIETETGDKFISLQAFDDPPVRAWFRGGGKGTPSTI